MSGRFQLNLSFLDLGTFSAVTLRGPPGATAAFNYVYLGRTESEPFRITSSGIVTKESFQLSVNNLTFTGSTLITEIYIRMQNTDGITSMTGTYPTALKTLQVGFNSYDPEFTLPNVETLSFAGKPGPYNLTTGSNLIKLDLPPNLNGLDTRLSTKLTTLPTLPSELSYVATPPGLLVLSGILPNLNTLDISRSTKLTTLSISGSKDLTTLTLPPSCTTLNLSGCSGLTSLNLPSKLVTLDITKCAGITGLKLPSTLTTLRIEGSGLQSLDLTGTNVTAINIPTRMDSQLKTLKLAGSKVKLTGLLRYNVPRDNTWILY